MLTFLQAWEQISQDGEDEDDPIMDSGEESIALRAIRNGMNLRKEECGDFWDDFLSVVNDADSVSELLGVQKEKITAWASKIAEARQAVEKADDQDSNGKTDKVVPTGNDGPKAHLGGVDAPQAGPAETRPGYA